MHTVLSMKYVHGFIVLCIVVSILLILVYLSDPFIPICQCSVALCYKCRSNNERYR